MCHGIVIKVKNNIPKPMWDGLKNCLILPVNRLIKNKLIIGSESPVIPPVITDIADTMYISHQQNFWFFSLTKNEQIPNKIDNVVSIEKIISKKAILDKIKNPDDVINISDVINPYFLEINFAQIKYINSAINVENAKTIYFMAFTEWQNFRQKVVIYMYSGGFSKNKFPFSVGENKLWDFNISVAVET